MCTVFSANSKRGMVLALIVASMLALLFLTPNPAYASTATGKLTASGGQSNKTDVWVLTSITLTKTKTVYSSGYSNSQARNNRVKYTYNSKGQLTRQSNPSYEVTFKYRNGRISSFSNTPASHANVSSGTLAYDSKNRISKMTRRDSFQTAVRTFTYNSKSRVVKEKQVFASSSSKTSTSVTYTYGKSGKLVKKSSTAPNRGNTTTTYSYDKHGNVAKKAVKANSTSSTTSYAFTYKNNRAVRSIETLANANYKTINTKMYSYKRVSVPNGLVSQVKAQQYDLLNHNDESFVLPSVIAPF